MDVYEEKMDEIVTHIGKIGDVLDGTYQCIVEYAVDSAIQIVNLQLDIWKESPKSKVYQHCENEVQILQSLEDKELYSPNLSKLFRSKPQYKKVSHRMKKYFILCTKYINTPTTHGEYF